MPNWCHCTLTVTGEAEELARFIEAARPRGEKGEDVTETQPLSFASFVAEPPEKELRKLERYQPCSMCAALGTLPDSPEQASERGAKWYPWMDPAEREDRTCNVCRGSGQERTSMEGWYEWRLRHWGTKWDANFSGPALALGGPEMDVEVSTDAQGATLTPTVAIYKFDTAWSWPSPVIEAASEQFPELEFSLRYGEVGHGYAGEERYVAGVLIDSEELEIEDVLAPEEQWF